MFRTAGYAATSQDILKKGVRVLAMLAQRIELSAQGPENASTIQLGSNSA